MRLILKIIIIFSFSACGKKDSNIFKLENSNFLKITDSLVFKIDSNTNPYPETFFQKDSTFLSLNTFNSSLTIFNYNSEVVFFADFNYLKKFNPRFNLTSAWYESLDSILIYSDNLNIIYLINSQKYIIDSFRTKKIIEDKSHFYPVPEITTKQKPFIYKNVIYTTGFLGGELKNLELKNRYIISKINHDTVNFKGSFPDEYKNNNWGGFYFRHVYNTDVVNENVFYSFSASSQIAIYNIVNDSFYFKKILPEIKDNIKALTGKNENKCSRDKSILPKHFYSQYSFGPIIYDKFRNVFYRFLLKPTENKFLIKDFVGPQDKFLITYDSNFNVLGYNDLEWKYSNFNFFVNSKGLYIQKIKQHEENYMYFTLFAYNSSTAKLL